MIDIERDISKGMEASYLKLKLNFLTDKEMFNTRGFSKKEDIADLYLEYS